MLTTHSDHIAATYICAQSNWQNTGIHYLLVLPPLKNADIWLPGTPAKLLELNGTSLQTSPSRRQLVSFD